MQFLCGLRPNKKQDHASTDLCVEGFRLERQRSPICLLKDFVSSTKDFCNHKVFRPCKLNFSFSFLVCRVSCVVCRVCVASTQARSHRLPIFVFKDLVSSTKDFCNHKVFRPCKLNFSFSSVVCRVSCVVCVWLLPKQECCSVLVFICIYTREALVRSRREKLPQAHARVRIDSSMCLAFFSLTLRECLRKLTPPAGDQKRRPDVQEHSHFSSLCLPSKIRKSAKSFSHFRLAR